MKSNQPSIEELPAFPPLGAFDLLGELSWGENLPLGSFFKRPYVLPQLSDLHGETPFADVGIAWSPKGISLGISVKKPLVESSFSDFSETDAVEIFIDTRDVKTTATLTRFCHHFLILPQKVDGVQAKEMTRFRGEESHPLCDPSAIYVATEEKKRGYSMKIEVSDEALYGYQPDEIPRIGFSYRIHRGDGSPQHFSATSHFFSLHLHPQLWGSFTLAPRAADGEKS